MSEDIVLLSPQSSTHSSALHVLKRLCEHDHVELEALNLREKSKDTGLDKLYDVFQKSMSVYSHDGIDIVQDCLESAIRSIPVVYDFLYE